MYYVDGPSLYRTFSEINRILFFNQLRVEDIVMMVDGSLDTEFSYCYREVDNLIYIGISDNFPKECHFRYVMMLEMIRLYQYQVENVEPSYGSTFKTFHHNGLKKFPDMRDPHEDCEAEIE